MIDSHAHLHDKKYDEDREAVIAACFESGLEAVVTIGTSVSESRDAVALASEHENIYATVGLHPQLFNASMDDPHEEFDPAWILGLTGEHDTPARMERLKKSVAELEQLAHDEKVRAIGEIGLEYYSHTDEPITVPQKKWQRTGFVVQIALARKLDLPVVVHCRPDDVVLSDAYHDCAAIVADYPDVQFVMHCYMGNVEVTEKLLAMPHVIFSFTGNITYSKKDDDQMSRVIAMIPLERMMIETDAPYLAPVPYRGTRNTPAYVGKVAERIAYLKHLTAEDVIHATTRLAKEFYRLP